MIITRESVLLRDNTDNAAVKDSYQTLLKEGITRPEAEHIIGNLVGILDDYAIHLGDGSRFQYIVRKRFLKLEIILIIPGESFDLFSEGDQAQKRYLENLLNLNAPTVNVSYKYRARFNIITLTFPLKARHKHIFTNPIILAVVLGLVFGLVIRMLPPDINVFLIDKIATPTQKVILNLISGVMGPVILISLISSISALGSVDELTNLGFKIIGRFLLIILFLTVVSILISGLIFQNFGSSTLNFSPDQLFDLILDMVPTNLVAPILNNNTAQLVILGLLMGIGILLLGDSVSWLKEGIAQTHKWVMTIMRIVMMTLPVIPFFSIMIALAKGQEREILSGWKFIIASYLIFTVCTLIKALKTSIRTGTRIPDLWAKVKSVAIVAFTTGSTTAALKSTYEVSDENLHIKSSFSSLWIPMMTAMLSPKTAVNVVIAAFMAAQLESIPVSSSFLIVLVIITLELSIASPGIPAACMVMLKTVGLPVEYVGLFTTYRLLTDNYGSACSCTYDVLEEYEIAHKLGAIEK